MKKEKELKKGEKIFDYLNAINNKTPLIYDKKIAPAYLLCLWLSHEKELLPYVNAINEHIFRLNDESVYQYFYNKIPKKRRFIKWIKKEKLDEKENEMVKNLMEKYEMSEQEAKRCLLN